MSYGDISGRNNYRKAQRGSEPEDGDLRDHWRAQTTAATADLACQPGLTAYDAAYLELAIWRGAALATQDQERLRAAEACGGSDSPDRQ